MRVSLSRPLSVDEAAGMLGGEPIGLDSKEMISGVTTDSREAMPHDLFVALEGRSASGESYCRDAAAKGAIPLSAVKGEGRITIVDNPRLALRRLAKRYKEEMPRLCHTVAITGSNGKTTSKNILFHLLAPSCKAHATEGNFNNDLGVSLTILGAPYDTEVMILELGMNHKGEISELSKTVCPTAAIITNVGTAHIGMLGSREEIANAKKEITHGMQGGRVYVSLDEPLLSDIADKSTVSMYNRCADLYAEVEESDSGYHFNLIRGQKALNNFRLNIKGEHILSNLLLCLAVALDIGIPPTDLRERCNNLTETITRHRITEASDFLIFDDTYNASLESITADLELLKKYAPRPLGAALGDVLELGDMSEEIHEIIGKRAVESGVDRFYLFGRYAEYISHSARSAGISPRDIFIAKSVEELAELVLKKHRTNEIILFKASHAVGLDKAIRILKR